MKSHFWFPAVMLLFALLVVSGCEKKGVEKEEAAAPPPETVKAAEAEPARGIKPEPAPGVVKEPAVKAADEGVEEVPKPAAPEAAKEAPGVTTTRLAYVRENGVPGKYKGMSNPLTATEEDLKKGEAIYRTQCAMCHGEKGLGDVPAGRSLTPPASNLSEVLAAKEATDAYLFWTVTEGGAPLKTQMFPFNSLTEPDRWRVILHIKTLGAE